MCVRAAAQGAEKAALLRLERESGRKQSAVMAAAERKTESDAQRRELQTLSFDKTRCIIPAAYCTQFQTSIIKLLYPIF